MSKRTYLGIGSVATFAAGIYLFYDAGLPQTSKTFIAIFLLMFANNISMELNRMK